MTPLSNKVTMADIANLLSDIGGPGKNRSAKDEAVLKLIQEHNISRTNFQGFDILDDIKLYPQY